MIEVLQKIWPHIMSGAALLITLTVTGHVVLYKRDSRSAVGWAGIVLLFPFLGALLYVLFGINRIERKAFILRANLSRAAACRHPEICYAESMEDILPKDAGRFASLALLISKVTHRPLLKGNIVEPLENGDKTYPSMIEAIHKAEMSVSLATYIFGNDETGSMFIDALSSAVKRGVEVRVLIDSVGARYSFPSAVKRLEKKGITVGRFLPTLLFARTKYMNLRNHRKILVADGKTGFTGGMNIRGECVVQGNPSRIVQDIHFKITGPVVSHLQEAFAEDWDFTTGEKLNGDIWFPELESHGDVIARGITDGPDEDKHTLRNAILGALTCARKSVRIITPYFLPDSIMISALNIAAMRGVRVEILLPEKNNLRMVQWAMTAQLWQVLEGGCRVWFSPPPFDHTKLMVVDDIWSLIGSANWDPRSLRLNFEFNVECYSRETASRLNAVFNAKRKSARPITLENVDSRLLPVKLRDGAARLFMPYL